jgi:hypothetical protein
MSPPKEVEDAVSRKSFFELFSDAVWFAYTSERMERAKEGTAQQRHRFVRSAILNSSLAIECAANCCLEDARVGKELRADLERMRTLAKFDLFLMSRARHSRLDRQSALVRPIEELIELRNAYVHPRVRHERPSAKPVTPEQAWKHLGIPRNPTLWNASHSRCVVICVSDFLNHFFFKVCRFNANKPQERSDVSHILRTTSRWSRRSSILVYSKVHHEKAESELAQAMRKWDLDFGFLGFYWRDNNGRLVRPKRKLGEH